MESNDLCNSLWKSRFNNLLAYKYQVWIEEITKSAWNEQVKHTQLDVPVPT